MRRDLGLNSPAVVGGGGRALTAAEFQGLAQVPPEAEWFANIDNPRTRRAYRIDIHEFMQFLGIAQPQEFRRVTRAHVLAWRKTLEGRVLSGATIRRKLAALSSLFEHLCDANTVTHNPVKGVKRPKELRGQDAGLGGSPGAGALEYPECRDAQGQAGSRDPVGLSLPRT